MLKASLASVSSSPYSQEQHHYHPQNILTHLIPTLASGPMFALSRHVGLALKHPSVLDLSTFARCEPSRAYANTLHAERPSRLRTSSRPLSKSIPTNIYMMVVLQPNRLPCTRRKTSGSSLRPPPPEVDVEVQDGSDVDPNLEEDEGMAVDSAHGAELLLVAAQVHMPEHNSKAQAIPKSKSAAYSPQAQDKVQAGE